MPRIQLAYWHGVHAPGDEINVSAEDLAVLTRDGRVAKVLDAPPAAANEPTKDSKSADVGGRRRP